MKNIDDIRTIILKKALLAPLLAPPLPFNSLNKNSEGITGFKLVKSKRNIDNIIFFNQFYKNKSINIKL